MSKIFEIDGIRRAKGKGEPRSSAAPSGAQPAAHSRLAQRVLRREVVARPVVVEARNVFLVLVSLLEACLLAVQRAAGARVAQRRKGLRSRRDTRTLVPEPG